MGKKYYTMILELTKEKGVFDLYVEGYYPEGLKRKNKFITGYSSEEFEEIYNGASFSLGVCEDNFCKLHLKGAENMSSIERNLFVTLVEKHNAKL